MEFEPQPMFINLLLLDNNIDYQNRFNYHHFHSSYNTDGNNSNNKTHNYFY